MSQTILTTQRLILRPYEPGDWVAAHQYGGDAETCQYQRWGPNTEDETREFVEDCVEASTWPEELGYYYAITLKEDGTLIGGCNLCHVSKTDSGAMIGYTINRDYWRQGYTSEAAAALLELGFTEAGLHRIVSWCTPENIGSWKVMEKIGMRREGHEREAVWFKGEWHDWLRYALLDYEWLKRQSALRQSRTEPVS